jgi:hypothetical protein
MYFKFDVFYFNQSLHKFSNHFFKNLILIRFKIIEAYYLYVYQKKFIYEISHMSCFLHFIMIWNLVIQKSKWQPQKKNDIEAWLNQLSNINIFRRNSKSRWVDFETTHQLDGCTQNLHMRVH